MSSIIQVMPIPLSTEASNRLAMLDVGLGMLPVLATYKEMLNQNSWKFDVHEFLSTMKAHDLVQEAFSGPKYGEKTPSLINMSISEQVLFETGLHYSYYTNIVQDVFKKIADYLKLVEFQNPEYLVEKLSVPEKSEMTQEMKIALELPNLPFDCNLEKYEIISDPELFNKRMTLTCKIAKELEDPDKIQNFLKSKNPELEILDKYKIRFAFPLVGSVRKQKNPTVLYVVTCYETTTAVSIEQAKIETDQFIPVYLQHNENLDLLLEECAFMCIPAGHQANIRKLVAMPKDSNHIFVVSLVTFFRQKTNSPGKDNDGFPV